MKSNNGMSKTVAGFVLVIGLLLAFVCSQIAMDGEFFGHTADNDTLNDIASWIGGLVAIAGVGMFFYGAMIFSRG